LNKPGLYFFFEPNEYRDREHRTQLRVTYIGKASRLWARLKDHSDDSDRSNPLSNMFWAMARREKPISFDRWVKAGWFKSDVYWADIKDDADYVAMRQLEYTKVLPYVQACSFTWLPRGENLEKHVISLLSNYQRPSVDPPSDSWLGHHSPEAKIRESGLWNAQHINAQWTDDWLDDFERLLK
jgi:hypothetical protein